jgi:hypothetical protein
LLKWHRIDQPRLSASETHPGASQAVAAEAGLDWLRVSTPNGFAATPAG